MTQRIELVGQRFGRLEVTKKLPNTKWCVYWECRCDCGSIKQVDGKALRRGSTRSCGCLWAESIALNSERMKLRPYEGLYNRFLYQRPELVSPEFTYEVFLGFTETNECHYCGTTVIWQKYSAKSCRYNLDRKDNKLGYTIDNCVVCCSTCNFTKCWRYTYEEWCAMVEALKQVRLINKTKQRATINAKD